VLGRIGGRIEVVIGEESEEIPVLGIVGDYAFRIGEDLIRDAQVLIADIVQGRIALGHFKQRFAFDAGNPDIFN